MSDPQTAPSAGAPPPAAPPTHPLRTLARVLLFLIAVIVGYLLLWPSPIDPVAYDPPPKPEMTGPFTPNDRLASAEILAAGQVDGPEDVDVNEQGQIFTGTADGRVVRVDPDGKLTTLVNTGGRPLGVVLAADGNLIVADAVKGLLSIDPAGKITVLSTSGGDQRLGFTDDLAVARDGTIYFSDASTKFGPGEYLYDMLEGRPHGRLLRFDPATQETTVLIPEMYFANGVALSQNEDFVLVNETYRYRVLRYWLKGDKAGQHDVFVDNLPGYPDNISSNGHGTFWLALFTVRNDQAEWLAPRPFIKGVLAKLPSPLWPKPEPYAFVVQLNEQGNVVDTFQDPQGKELWAVTSACERDGYLYLGSLHNDRIGKYKLP